MMWPAGVGGLALVVVMCGCAKPEAETSPPPTRSSPAASSQAASEAAMSTSPFDQGPRASESEADEELAKQGETLFQEKGCSACHAFGKRVTGPDLAGVTRRRTAKWIERQILEPDKMAKEDPIARKLFAEFALQMPNQGLTQAQARAVLEYLRHRDHGTVESD